MSYSSIELIVMHVSYVLCISLTVARGKLLLCQQCCKLKFCSLASIKDVLGEEKQLLFQLDAHLNTTLGTYWTEFRLMCKGELISKNIGFWCHLFLPKHSRLRITKIQ